MMFFNGKSFNHINMSKDDFREVFYILILYFQAFSNVDVRKNVAAIFKSLFIKVKPTPG